MKIKINSDDDLPLENTLNRHIVVVLIHIVLKNYSYYYYQVFLEKCSYKLTN